MQVIDNLIDHIYNKYKEHKIYILLQKNSMESFQKKYPDFIYIQKEDGYFSYSKYKKNKELINFFKNNTFDEVYIPTSYQEYRNFTDTFLIASSIQSGKYFLFNKDSIEKRIKLNKIVLISKKYWGAITYGIKLLVATFIIIITYLLCSIFNVIGVDK